MEEQSLLFHIGPIWFDGTVAIMSALVCAIIFLIVFICTRNPQLKPTGKQNFIEWVIDFVRGILSDQLPAKEVGNFHLLGFTLFLFVFCLPCICVVFALNIYSWRLHSNTSL